MPRLLHSKFKLDPLKKNVPSGVAIFVDPPTRGTGAFWGLLLFFVVSLTALKWAALGRQMGWVAGSKE